MGRPRWITVASPAWPWVQSRYRLSSQQVGNDRLTSRRSEMRYLRNPRASSQGSWASYRPAVGLAQYFHLRRSRGTYSIAIGPV
jgi:hypothetical protein